MNRLVILGLCLVTCLLCISCSDDKGDDIMSCNVNDFVSTCSVDMTGVTACQNGSLIKVECPSHRCDKATNKCIESTDCTESTYTAVCTSGRVRQFCQGGHVVTENCTTGNVCANGACKPIDDSLKCTDADYPSTCQDEHTRLYCNDGIKDFETCKSDEICSVNACISDDSCTTDSYPESCIDGQHRAFCNIDHHKDVENCPSGTICNGGKCQASTGGCDSSFKETCENPLVRVYCDGGTIKREECKNGAICNASLSKKQCKTPAVGDACNPMTFSEMCYGSSKARICDEETFKVIEVDCKDYGSGYNCDMAENYYGPGLNVTICYSKDEACDGPGDDDYGYCYEDDDTGYRHFYKITYTCAEFNLGYHLYNSGDEDCSKDKCGQKEIRHACDDL